MGKRVLSGALLVAMAACALICFAQFWLHWHWVSDFSDRCDFPEECIGQYLPGVYRDLGWWWLVGALLGWLVVILAVMAKSSHASLFRLSAAGAAASLWFFVTPIWYGRDNIGWRVHHQPVSIDLTYALALLLLAVAGTLYAWEVGYTLSGQPSVRRTRLPSVARP